MATNYKIRLRRFNGLDYDTLNLSSENIIRNNGNTVEQEFDNIEQEFDNIIPSSNGILKNNNGIFNIATLGADYTAVDDSLTSSTTKTYSITKQRNTFSTFDMLGIVIDGNSTPVGASVGQYVIVKNSTISGITDGLYKAAQAIPANTAIDSTYLTAVNGGGLNDLTSYENLTVTRNTTEFSFASWAIVSAERIGNTVYVRVSGFRPLQSTQSGSTSTLITISGVESKGNVVSPILLLDGGVQGRCGINNGSNSVYVASVVTANTDRFVSFAFPV